MLGRIVRRLGLGLGIVFVVVTLTFIWMRRGTRWAWTAPCWSAT
jgi:hypothetical protein